MKIDNFIKPEKKKSLFCNAHLLPLYSTTLAFTNDVLMLKKIFTEKYDRVQFDILTHIKSNQKADAPEFYKEWNEIDLNDYDEIIIGTTINQVFGGVYRKNVFDLYKSLISYKGDIYYYFNDIDSYPFDFGGTFKRRSLTNSGLRQAGSTEKYDKFTEEDFDKLTEISHNIKILSSWHNYDVIVNKFKTKKDFCNLDWTFFDMNQCNVASYIYKDIQSEYIPLNERKYDLLFYSVNFKFKKRLSVINNYIKDEDTKLFIGLKENEDNIPNVTNFGNTKINDIITTYMPQCKYTLIFSCPEANDNVITWRYYECMYGNTLAFILNDFDPEHKYVKNDELKSYIYINSPEEYFDKVKYCNEHEDFYKHLINLEREEILNL